MAAICDPCQALCTTCRALRAIHHPSCLAPPLIASGVQATSQLCRPTSRKANRRAHDPTMQRSSQGRCMLHFDGNVPIALMRGDVLQS
jgi:hypothetical protein